MLAIADVAVVVRSAEVASAWWTGTLGFAEHTVGGSGHARMVAPPGEPFLLHLCEGFEPVSPGNTGIAFVTDDFDRWVERMRAGNVVFDEPPTRDASGARARFADPDGNVFWLIEAPAALIRTEVGRRAPGGARAKRRRAPRRASPPARRKARVRPRRR